jgi:hypothetical protein
MGTPSFLSDLAEPRRLRRPVTQSRSTARFCFDILALKERGWLGSSTHPVYFIAWSQAAILAHTRENRTLVYMHPLCF